MKRSGVGALRVIASADESTLRLVHDIDCASQAVDHVDLPADPFEELLASVDPSVPDAGEKVLFRLAQARDHAVGMIQLRIPTMDNLRAATVSVKVHPTHRRQGHGRRILNAAIDEVRSMGRNRIYFETPSAYPSGEPTAAPLLRSIGAKAVLTDIRRILDLRVAEQVTLHAPHADYELIQWIDRAPEVLVEDLAQLEQAMSTDPPMGDLEYEPEQWDATRYRDAEHAARARGRIRFATAAIHRLSGAVVGMTDIAINRHRPEVAYQWNTIVSRAHRGHRLGIAMKSHNLHFLRSQMKDVQQLNTWNAASNVHMIAVNELMGFKPVELWTEWQLDL